jgi:hypothetical protein
MTGPPSPPRLPAMPALPATALGTSIGRSSSRTLSSGGPAQQAPAGVNGTNGSKPTAMSDESGDGEVEGFQQGGWGWGWGGMRTGNNENEEGDGLLHGDDLLPIRTGVASGIGSFTASLFKSAMSDDGHFTDGEFDIDRDSSTGGDGGGDGSMGGDLSSLGDRETFLGFDPLLIGVGVEEGMAGAEAGPTLRQSTSSHDFGTLGNGWAGGANGNGGGGATGNIKGRQAATQQQSTTLVQLSRRLAACGSADRMDRFKRSFGTQLTDAGCVPPSMYRRYWLQGAVACCLGVFIGGKLYVALAVAVAVAVRSSSSSCTLHLCTHTLMHSYTHTPCVHSCTICRYNHRDFLRVWCTSFGTTVRDFGIAHIIDPTYAIVAELLLNQVQSINSTHTSYLIHPYAHTPYTHTPYTHTPYTAHTDSGCGGSGEG